MNAFAHTERANQLYSWVFESYLGGVFERSVYYRPSLVQLWYIDAFRFIVKLNVPTNGITKFMSTYLISKMFLQLQMYTIIVYIYVYSSLTIKYT